MVYKFIEKAAENAVLRKACEEWREMMWINEV